MLKGRYLMYRTCLNHSKWVNISSAFMAVISLSSCSKPNITHYHSHSPTNIHNKVAYLNRNVPLVLLHNVQENPCSLAEVNSKLIHHLITLSNKKEWIVSSAIISHQILITQLSIYKHIYIYIYIYNQEVPKPSVHLPGLYG